MTSELNIKVGDTLPEGTFKYIPWTDELKDNLTCGRPIDLKTDAWKDKKIILISVPGAFTPTCHVNHLPPYLQKYDELKAKGVDAIYVLAANDPFVMSGWARSQGFGDKIIAISDTYAEWSKSLGLSLDVSARGLGIRTNRYVLIVDHGKVTSIEVEKAAPGEDLQNTNVETTLKNLS